MYYIINKSWRWTNTLFAVQFHDMTQIDFSNLNLIARACFKILLCTLLTYIEEKTIMFFSLGIRFWTDLISIQLVLVKKIQFSFSLLYAVFLKNFPDCEKTTSKILRRRVSARTCWQMLFWYHSLKKNAFRFLVGYHIYFSSLWVHCSSLCENTVQTRNSTIFRICFELAVSSSFLVLQFRSRLAKNESPMNAINLCY